jgi:hypothetical protein
MQGYGDPKPTHSDMAVIPAQGRDPAAVAQDVADARAVQHARVAQPDYPGPQWVYDNDNDGDSDHVCGPNCGCGGQGG